MAGESRVAEHAQERHGMLTGGPETEGHADVAGMHVCMCTCMYMSVCMYVCMYHSLIYKRM